MGKIDIPDIEKIMVAVHIIINFVSIHSYTPRNES